MEKYADLFQQGRFQLLFAKTYLVHVTPIITQGVCEVIPYVNVLKFSHLWHHDFLYLFLKNIILGF